MARKSRVTVTMGPYVGHGKIFELTILGTTVNFEAASFSNISGAKCYYAQVQNPNSFSLDIQNNVASLASSVNAYLESVSENRFEVTSSVFYTNGFPTGGSVTLRAKLYSDSLNLPFTDLSSGDNDISLTGTTNDSPQTASFLKTDVSCYGAATGDIFLEVTGGMAPYTFQWEDGPTTKDRPMVGHGLYRVVITDSAVPLPLNPDLPFDSPFQTFSDDHPGVVVLEVPVGEPARIAVVANVLGQNVSVAVSGGTPGYTYSWSDGSTEKDRAALVPATYLLTVTDAAGCQTTVSVLVRDFRFYFSRNPVTLPLSAASPDQKPNLSFLYEVWVENGHLSGEFGKVTQEPLEQPADSDGTTLFDVRELLDAYVQPHLPPFGTAGVQRADLVFRRFFLKYTEKHGTPPVPDVYTQVDTQYVLCGGLDLPETQADTFFTGFLKNRKPFFTWDLPEKGVYADQPEYLYFMPDSFDLERFSVRAKVRFADGTGATQKVYSQAALNRFELYCLPVGHAQLGLGMPKPGVAVKGWDIYVQDSEGNVISETRRFSLLEDFGEKRRYLLYANSLGGINTLVATGKAKLKLDPDSVTLERSLLPGTPSDRHGLEVRSKSGKVTMELSTGYREPREILALQDFLLSDKVWLIENDRYTPVTVVDRNQVPLDEAEEVGFLDFEIQFPRRHRYTPQLRLGGYTDQTAELKPLLP